MNGSPWDFKPGDSRWEVREGYVRNVWVSNSQWPRALLPLWCLFWQSQYLAAAVWGAWKWLHGGMSPSPYLLFKYVLAGALYVWLWFFFAGWLVQGIRAWRKPSVIEATPEWFYYDEPFSFRRQLWLRGGDIESIRVDQARQWFDRRWCLRIDLRAELDRTGLRRRTYRLFSNESRSSLEGTARALRYAMRKPESAP